MPAGRMFLAAKPKRPVPQNVRRYVRNQVRKEAQDLDTLVSVSAEDAAYNTESMNDLTPCSGLIGGARFRLKELDVGYRLQAQSTTSTVARVIIFQWFHDDNTDVPTLEDILGNTASSESVIDRYDKESVWGHEMKVLYDRVHILGKTSSLEGNDHAVGKFRIFNSKLPRKYIKGTASGKGTNKIYCLALSNVVAGATAPHITIEALAIHEATQQN